MPTSTRRAALYVRVSTADRDQTVENQLQPLQEAAGRLGRSIVAVFRDKGISGARGREQAARTACLAEGQCGSWWLVHERGRPLKATRANQLP